ncbi:MAG: PH domain-containing protein [Acholeplasmatales bacterium]|nr:PH domain-containing protein [Acholeplasmatales bacterium]
MSIKDYKLEDEEILWTGKPNKSVYVKERIFSPLMIFAFLWLAIDAGFIVGFFVNISDSFGSYIIIPFFMLHLMPVWLYLGRIFTSVSSWRNTEYMVTDKAVYVKTGVFNTSCDRKTFQEITNVSVHQGIIDKSHNVGDVFIVAGVSTTSTKSRGGMNIVDIEDYMKVYKIITKVGRDIFSDTMYPNDLRPNENHGYNTSYKKDDFE